MNTPTSTSTYQICSTTDTSSSFCLSPPQPSFSPPNIVFMLLQICFDNDLYGNKIRSGISEDSKEYDNLRSCEQICNRPSHTFSGGGHVDVAYVVVEGGEPHEEEGGERREPLAEEGGGPHEAVDDGGGEGI
ncbi:unnamed protein product [Lactuca virosa]|uniref:Uncharacterized protein n=1 Tax=Lactuca virosa TaxID=75947 RepID=A0AAU9PH00_9ASTR|nr:unnamed protein product [Lactuca virosa]